MMSTIGQDNIIYVPPAASSALPSSLPVEDPIQLSDGESIEFSLNGSGKIALSLAQQVLALQDLTNELGSVLKYVDRTAEFGELVSASSLRKWPVHRWYYYKEGFSPELAPLIVSLLGTGSTGSVVDPFAGVGTSILALKGHGAVNRVVGVEYSPFACFVGRTKLESTSLNPSMLLKHVQGLRDFDVPSAGVQIPALAAFRNPDIFDPGVVQLLVAARDSIRDNPELSERERAFFLLGLAASIEDLSKAMKDGRALRILRGRKRRRQALAPSRDAVEGNSVHAVLSNQWLAMIEDIGSIPSTRSDAPALQVRGDARTLGDITDSADRRLIPEESVGLYIYSPPYLNCVDYSEVYKLELWLLGMVTDQTSFRSLREGTLRSHPSIEFPQRSPSDDRDTQVFKVIDEISDFLACNLSRASVGRIVGHYFADMHEVIKQQYKTLEPGGAVACVVANSVFSRRIRDGDQWRELWRLPVMTDVILARLLEAVGFAEPQIWVARTLQSKNVSGGSARESVVVARKPRVH